MLLRVKRAIGEPQKHESPIYMCFHCLRVVSHNHVIVARFGIHDAYHRDNHLMERWEVGDGVRKALRRCVECLFLCIFMLLVLQLDLVEGE